MHFLKKLVIAHVCEKIIEREKLFYKKTRGITNWYIRAIRFFS